MVGLFDRTLSRTNPQSELLHRSIPFAKAKTR